jgi:hypothetical protein
MLDKACFSLLAQLLSGRVLLQSPAELWHAGDGVQRALRSRFPPRLMPSVRLRNGSRTKEGTEGHPYDHH